MQLPNKVNRIIKVCLLLISISTFIIVVIGIALVSIQEENKDIKKFLAVGKDTHLDFENSLVMYTEKTRDTIQYLLKLRPNNEGEVIKFISQIEKIGQDSYLDIELATLGELIKTKNKKINENDDTISYKISFLGSIDDLNKFLSKIEALPYFIRVESVNFRDMTNSTKPEYLEPNVVIVINLYIKNDKQQKS